MLNRTRTLIAGIAVFSIFATSAFAATGTADKPLNSSKSVESVSIQGTGGTGTPIYKLICRYRYGNW